jgi:hypothetical protein
MFFTGVSIEYELTIGTKIQARGVARCFLHEYLCNMNSLGKRYKNEV